MEYREQQLTVAVTNKYDAVFGGRYVMETISMAIMGGMVVLLIVLTVFIVSALALSLEGVACPCRLGQSALLGRLGFAHLFCGVELGAEEPRHPLFLQLPLSESTIYHGSFVALPRRAFYLDVAYWRFLCTLRCLYRRKKMK